MPTSLKDMLVDLYHSKMSWSLLKNLQ